MNTAVAYLVTVLLATSAADPSDELKPEVLNAFTEESKKEFAKASCDFALDLLKTSSLEDEDNVLLSPSSISVLLAILQQGARGNTAMQLEKVLHLSAEHSRLGYGHVIKSLEREKTNTTLEWGNRGYVVPGFELNETFLKTIDESFNATVDVLNLGEMSAADAAAKVNDWVKEATHDYIKDLVDEGLMTPDLIMLMVNAIYFKSVWGSPFHKFKTRDEKFHLSDQLKVEVPFMRQAGRFVAGENTDLGIKWTELPFQDDNFSMIFILPIKAHGINQVLEKLTGADLKDIIGSKETRRVKLTIPRFKISKKISLAKTLQKLELTDVFTIESDLSGISTSDNALFLSHLIHQAHLEIDEDGSTAAAATFEIVQTLSFEWYTDELQFRADHPFLFFIVDKLNEIPIFAGKITNPKMSPPPVSLAA